MLPLGGTAHGTHPLTIGLPSREAGGQEDSGRSCKPKVEVEKPCRSRRGWQVEMAQRDWPHTEGDQAAAPGNSTLHVPLLPCPNSISFVR